VPELLAERLLARFPKLKVAGTYSPPFADPISEEDDRTIDRINASAPNIIWVGLGTPKQDLWMALHRNKLNASVPIGFGAAFDIHSGRVPQAPPWMQKAGLEWLFRLWQEPWRLWYRYLVYNPLFLTLILLQAVGLKRYSIQ
jgi:N-acetylglucosaminyldiphosphoundecaprenol N-acetyl-beta-D-mannosaminyltransferase